jgi:hypothetical protein
MNDGPHSNTGFTAEYRAFRLASELTEFDYYTRNNWCSWETGGNSESPLDEAFLLPDVIFARLQSAELLMARLSSVLTPPENQQGLLQEGKRGLATWFDMFSREFHSDIRLTKIQQLARTDPDPEWDATPFLLGGSPFESDEWRRMMTSLSRFVHALPRRARRCFRLSHILMLECLHGRITRRMGCEAADPRVWVPARLSQLLQPKIQRLQEEIPRLEGLASDFSVAAYWNGKSRSPSFGYRNWLREGLATLHETISTRLCEVSDDSSSKPTKTPRWQPETGELWYDGKILKKFPERAKNQRRILDEFEGQDWPREINDPLLPRDLEVEKLRERLKDTIKSLNEGLAKKANGASPIQFKPIRNLAGVAWLAPSTS